MTTEEKLEVLSLHCHAILDENSPFSEDCRVKAHEIFWLQTPLPVELFLLIENLLFPSPPVPGQFNAAIPPVMAALRHPDCPTSLLTRACQSDVSYYGYLASLHPNCLEEDAVYWALNHR